MADYITTAKIGYIRAKIGKVGVKTDRIRKILETYDLGMYCSTHFQGDQLEKELWVDLETHKWVETDTSMLDKLVKENIITNQDKTEFLEKKVDTIIFY